MNTNGWVVLLATASVAVAGCGNGDSTNTLTDPADAEVWLMQNIEPPPEGESLRSADCVRIRDGEFECLIVPDDPALKGVKIAGSLRCDSTQCIWRP